VKSGGKRVRGKRRATPGAAVFRSPLTAIAAALALLVQLVVLPYHQALSAPVAPSAASDIATVAAELKAVFGDAAALCVQSDDPGAPGAPSGDCDDHCPLCQFAAQASALLAPDLPALPDRFDAACRALGVRPEPGALPLRPAHQHRARAPPFAV